MLETNIVLEISKEEYKSLAQAITGSQDAKIEVNPPNKIKILSKHPNWGAIVLQLVAKSIPIIEDGGKE